MFNFRLKDYLKSIVTHTGKGAYAGQIKFYRRWNKSLHKNSSSIRDEQPWITYDAIDFLKKHRDSKPKVFEYGGGGSTLFWLSYSKEVITVEHDKKWFDLLTEEIKKRNYKNWKGYFIEPANESMVENPDLSNPDHYYSDNFFNEPGNFFEYVSVIDQYPDNYFDIILIDGRARPSCIKHSIPKLAEGGFLILDNSDREYYLTFLKDVLKNNFTVLLDRFGPCPYVPQFSQTTIWKKNSQLATDRTQKKNNIFYLIRKQVGIYSERKKIKKLIRIQSSEGKIKVVVGRGITKNEGWIDTDVPLFNILKEKDWNFFFSENSINNLLAEHVLEHLTEEEVALALSFAYRYLKPGGCFRIAVPDGYHRDAEYLKHILPPADGHHSVWNIETLQKILHHIGFRTQPLEYYSKDGTYHSIYFDFENGKILRSKAKGYKNKNHPDYSSLIIDCYKN